MSANTTPDARTPTPARASRRVRVCGPVARAMALALAVSAGALLAGCGSLLGPAGPAPQRLSLDGGGDIAPAAAPAAADAPVLLVSTPTAAAGYTSDRMIYLRAPQQPEPYADHAWVAVPARMLAPLLVEALSRSGGFAAVVGAPAVAAAPMRLDAQVLRLAHVLYGGPGRVRFTLRVVLVDTRGGAPRVLSRDFDAEVPTARDDAAGAATAAQAAVRQVLGQVAAFAAAQARAGTASAAGR